MVFGLGNPLFLVNRLVILRIKSTDTQAKPKAAFYLALADMTDGQPGVDVAVTLWLRACV